MPLSEGQVSVRDLVLGPGTPYVVLPGFNPFNRSVRADAGGARAWNHGSWSGAEWMDEAVVQIPVAARGDGRSIGDWLSVHQPLAAAFAPVGDRGEEVELRWTYGGVEYLMIGRPRLVEPATSTIAAGRAITRCGMVCQDPRIYSGELHEVSTGLPSHAGGLTVPLTVPFTVPGVLDGGRAELANAGTADAAVVLRIDGPAADPRIVIQRPDGEIQQAQFHLTIQSGQWLDVDSAGRTALLNGLPESNQRGRAAWDIDPHPLAPGTSVLRFLAAEENETAQVTAWWRSAWW